MSWPDGVDRVVLDEVDSTSAEAGRRAPAVPTWVMARRQTAGRGRRGRAWSMPEGNFAASLAWRPPGTPADWARRSFVASLALHDALTALGIADLSLKWPNDVLHRGGKLAGLLLEAPVPGLVVLGVGVNLAAVPPTDALETGALRPAALDGTIQPEVLLDALASAYAAREAEFTTWGFAPIRAAWLARAAGLGTRIAARTVTDTRHGTFEDVDADGRLLLRTAAGLDRIAAADVFFAEVPCS